jgi:lipopolysaccharide export system permease protein
MLPIIDRYILVESARSFLAILGVLLLILISHGFMKLLQQAAAGILSNEVLLTLVGLKAVLLLGVVIPPTFFFAILYTLGRMYRDSEITALAAGGVGLGRIYRAYFLLAVPLALLVGWLTLSLGPQVNNLEEEIRDQQRQTAELGTAVAGRFNEFGRGDLVFFVEGMSEDRQALRHIFVQHRQHGKLGIVTATEGRQYIDPATGDPVVVLEQGYRYEGMPGQSDFSIGEFGRYGVRILDETREQRGLPRDARPSAELRDSDDLRDRSEFQFRLLAPVSVLVFTLASIPLARSLPREGIYGRMVMAILFYFVYVNLQALSGAWMRNGVTPEWLGRWWIGVVMLLLALAISLFQRLDLAPLWRRLPQWRGGAA